MGDTLLVILYLGFIGGIIFSLIKFPRFRKAILKVFLKNN